MSVLCTIPGLIWPTLGLSEILSGLALPGLSTLLAQARTQRASPCSRDAWLCAQFGLATSGTNTPPFAALRLAGESLTEQDSCGPWVCADPVRLRFARQHLLLDGPTTLDLHADEIQHLTDDLNKSFADIGRFQFCSPTRGYLALDAAHADKLDVALASLPDAINRPVAQFQPQGAHAAWWSHLSNELQVFCHTHAVNIAREARGAPTLNALWLWGAGATPSRLTAPAARLAARGANADTLLRGLAKIAHSPIEEFDLQQPADWSLFDDLHEPTLQRDEAAWASALTALDTELFVPLAALLRSRKITHLQLVAPGDTSLTCFDIVPAPRWQFWQPSLSKSQLIAALSGPALSHTAMNPDQP